MWVSDTVYQFSLLFSRSHWKGAQQIPLNVLDACQTVPTESAWAQ
jgi:hypothetical protein